LDTTGTTTSWTRYACTTANGYCGDGLLRYEVSAQDYDKNGNGQGYTINRLDGFDRAKYTEVQTLSGASSVVQKNFDNLGRLSQKSTPYFAGAQVYYTTYGYDLISRLLNEQRQVSEVDNSTETVQYTYARLTRTVQDANSHTTSITLSARGEVLQVTDPALGSTSYLYEPFGNLGQITDPAGNTSNFTYDVRGFKLTADDPDMGHWSYTHYLTGELWTQTDANLNQITLGYDRVGRPVSRSEPEGQTVWTYGHSLGAKNIGQLVSVTSPGSYAESYTYDTLARPQDEKTTIDGTDYVVSRGYDSVTGFLSTVTYPNSTTAVAGSRLTVQYNYQNGVLQSVADTNSPGTVYWQAMATDAAGHATDEQYGNALHTHSTYDAITRLLASRTTGSSSQIQNLSYHWDKVGNLTERQDLGLSLKEDFIYDVRDRLDHSTLTVGAGAPSVNLAMGYDAIGNITSKSDVGSYDYTAAQGACSYTGLTAQPHAVRKVGSTSYCYDKNGSMILRGSDALTWTSYHMPSQINQGANSSQFFYGASRDRYKEVTVATSGGSLPAGTETTLFVGGIFERVTKPSGVLEYKHYIIGGTGPVAVRTLRSNGVNDTRYLHKDHLGGIDTITDESGSISLKLSFDAFGKRRSPTTWGGTPSSGDWTSIAAVTHRGFTSHEQLDNVGLIHMNGRVYDPTIGRFLSADPVVQAPFMSQSLNRYSYVMNNPLSFVDPTGYDGEPTDTVTVTGSNSGGGGSGGGGGFVANVPDVPMIVITAQQPSKGSFTPSGYMFRGYIDYPSHLSDWSEGDGEISVTVVGKRSTQVWMAVYPGLPIGDLGGEEAVLGHPDADLFSLIAGGDLKLGGTLIAAGFKVFAIGATKASSRALARALIRAGKGTVGDVAAHHIVAGDALAAAPARAILQRFGIGINDAENGVFLPRSAAAGKAMGSAAAIHAGGHSAAYYDLVNEALNSATSRQEAVDTLDALGQALRNGSLKL
jgi:RHS repeat-associated protein